MGLVLLGFLFGEALVAHVFGSLRAPTSEHFKEGNLPLGDLKVKFWVNLQYDMVDILIHASKQKIGVTRYASTMKFWKTSQQQALLKNLL